MATLVSDILGELSLFHSHKGGIKEVVDNDSPSRKYVVIDEMPKKNMATYCIHTTHGWVVFSRTYTEPDILYPSVYGLLFKILDIDTFTDASFHGMSIGDIDNVCKEILK